MECMALSKDLTMDASRCWFHPSFFGRELVYLRSARLPPDCCLSFRFADLDRNHSAMVPSTVGSCSSNVLGIATPVPAFFERVEENRLAFEVSCLFPLRRGTTYAVPSLGVQRAYPSENAKQAAYVC